MYNNPVTGLDLDGHQSQVPADSDQKSLQASCNAAWADGTYGNCEAEWQIMEQPWIALQSQLNQKKEGLPHPVVTITVTGKFDGCDMSSEICQAAYRNIMAAARQIAQRMTGKAPNNRPTTAQLFECASKTANQFSIAGFAGLTSGGGSFGSKAGKAIGTAFLGNTFSNISDMFTHVGAGNFAAAYGDFALGGTAQGLLPGATSASAKGLVGAMTDAAVGETLGAEMIEPVGWAKLGIDAIVYAGSMLSCVP